MPIYTIPEMVGHSYLTTKNNIMTVFRVSGMCRLNKIIFEDNEFLPSEIANRPIPIDFLA